MKCEITTKPSYAITLTHDEAVKLIGLVQNPVADEPEDYAAFRRNMFEMLKHYGVKPL